MRPRQAARGIHDSRRVVARTSITQTTQTYRGSSRKQKSSPSPHPRMIEKNRCRLEATGKPGRIWIELGQVCAQVRNLCIKMNENEVTKAFLSECQLPTLRELNTVFNCFRSVSNQLDSDASKRRGVSCFGTISIFILSVQLANHICLKNRSYATFDHSDWSNSYTK